MKATFKFILSLIIVLLFQTVQSTQAAPAFWKVKSKTAEIYLFGSIHAGNPSMYPLPEIINNAYINSQHLTVEVDIISPSMLKSIGWLWLNGTLADSKTIDSVLDKDTLALLKKTLTQYKIPYTSIERLKPWIIALNLESLNMTSAELKPQYGIDLHFLTRAHRSRKSVLQLESAEEQFGLFENMTMPQQIVLLKETLKNMISSDDVLGKLVKFWSNGDIDSLEKLILSEMKSDPDSEFFYDLLLTNRNRKMADKIAAYLDTKDKYFVVVGAAHYLGPDSIIRFLHDKGIEVERIE
ncbi:MAG TPA: TraB/GumN family protein [Aeromonadales bacterium]|nr:TraB/GumN family protein [Aeromonadales bacterium]